MQPNDSVADLKAQVASKMGIPIEHQQLLLGEQMLGNDLGVLGELMKQDASVQVYRCIVYLLVKLFFFSSAASSPFFFFSFFSFLYGIGGLRWSIRPS